MVIATCSLRSTLPDDFISACHTAHLSRLATTASQTLSKQIWMVDSYPNMPSAFSGLLQLNLACIPRSLLSKAKQFSEKQFSMLFNLSVIHTSVSFQLKKGNELAPVHYSNLVTSIDRLVSMVGKSLEVSLMFHFLIELVVDLYSSCLQKEIVEDLAQKSLLMEHCIPRAEYSPVAGVKMTVPATSSSEKLSKRVEEAVKSLKAVDIDYNK